MINSSKKTSNFGFKFIILITLIISIVVCSNFLFRYLFLKDLSNTITPALETNKGEQFLLGDERLLTEYLDLIKNKRIGIITNQTGVTSDGTHIIDILMNDDRANVTALYAPEHGIDGKAKAGEYVASYVDEQYGIPVYSLYSSTRKPTPEMLENIDVLIVDLQDIGSRSYTYISTLNYAMIAAKENNKSIIILDRPNPLSATLVDGYVLEDPYKSFVGVDNLPYVHGMTIGEIGKFFNRNIGADLSVVPMKGYTRDTTFEETGLNWVQTSPMIPTLEAARNYPATGISDGIGAISQSDYFSWTGGPDINSDEFAILLNAQNIKGVTFTPDTRGNKGGVKLTITDPKTYNPVLVGYNVLSIGKKLTNYEVPKTSEGAKDKIMFEKIMGTDKIGQYLEANLSADEIVSKYSNDLEKFKTERKKYLIYK